MAASGAAEEEGADDAGSFVFPYIPDLCLRAEDILEPIDDGGDRQTHRQTDTQTQTQTHRHTDTQTHRHRHRDA